MARHIFPALYFYGMWKTDQDQEAKDMGEHVSLEGQYKKGERKAFNPPAAVVIFPGYDETCDPDLLHTKRYTRRRRRGVEGGGRKVCGDISGYVCSFP